MDYKKRHVRDDIDEDEVAVKEVMNLIRKHMPKANYALDYLNDALRATDTDDFYEKLEDAYTFLNRLVYYVTMAKNDLDNIRH